MQSGLEKLGGLNSNASQVKKQITRNSVNLKSNLEASIGIRRFGFNQDMPLDVARNHLEDFSNELSLESINNMEDLKVLKELIGEMSEYLLKYQFEIRKLPKEKVQDFKVSFTDIQGKIKKMGESSEFIKKLSTNNNMLKYDKAVANELAYDLNVFYKELGVVYNAVVAIYRVVTFKPVPKQMKVIETFPGSFDKLELATNTEKFRVVLNEIRNMSDYIVNNEKEINKFPAIQLQDFKETLELIIGEVRVMLSSDIFNQPQLYNLKKLDEPDSKLHKAYNSVDASLKFSSDLPLQKAVDLIGTFGQRMNPETISQSIDNFGVFLQDIRSMSKYMSYYKTDIKLLPPIVLKELKQGLEDVEERIKTMLEMEGLQPKMIYNLNKLLKKDLPTAGSIAKIN